MLDAVYIMVSKARIVLILMENLQTSENDLNLQPWYNENWPFPVLWPQLSFPDLLAYWVQHFHSIIFQDRVPDELWNEVCDIVQETGIKTILKEKKCKKAKWLSGEALQIAVKRREAKS